MVGFVTYMQRRWTGGIRLIHDGFQIQLDPGSGSIVRSINAGLSPQKVKALFVSHSHPDHSADAEIFIEAMTSGGTKSRGTLVASKSVLSGNEDCDPSISRYHQRTVGKVIEAKPKDVFHVEQFKIKVTKAVHSDPDAVGYRFELSKIGAIAYTCDTEYFEGIEDYYKGVRLMIMCVMRPRQTPWKGHLSTDDAVRILKNVKPETAIITHFGMRMIQSNPEKQASFIEEQTGVPTKAAFDGMSATIDDREVIFSSKRDKDRRVGQS